MKLKKDDFCDRTVTDIDTYAYFWCARNVKYRDMENNEVYSLLFETTAGVANSERRNTILNEYENVFGSWML